MFVNLYGGNFAQKMELNRKGVERVLKIAHLDGQVFLSSFSPNRPRSIEANPDGSVSVKRNLFFGEKIEEDKENPLYKVVSVPEGWRGEVNDTRIREELQEKNLAGEKLQKAFIEKFDLITKKIIRECVWREKLSSEKDKYFRSNLLFSGVNGAIPASAFIMNPSAIQFIWFLGGIFMINGMGNALGYLTDRSKNRNIDNPLEVFMPYVEIDKVARTYVYLASKGRRLVREARTENNQPKV